MCSAMQTLMLIGSELFLQELMTHVESFQCEAQKVIQSGTTDVARLQQLLDNGHTLDVDLPEIPKLKQVRTSISVKAQMSFITAGLAQSVEHLT